MIDGLSKSPVTLRQDTQDIAQLDPVSRMRSIDRVWTVCCQKLGQPSCVLDAGAGFGYGTAYLALQSLSVVGVEVVHHKISQGINLFKGIGFHISMTEQMSWNCSPAMYQGDIRSLTMVAVADLITMFYLSNALISDPATFLVCKSMLRKGGRMLLSTQAPASVVRARLVELNPPFQTEVIEIPGNFEQTAIIFQ